MASSAYGKDPILQARIAVAVDLSSTDFVSVNGSTLYVGGTGDVKVDMAGGTTGITFVGVPVGTFMPIQVTKVYKTGTGATNLVAMS